MRRILSSIANPRALRRALLGALALIGAAGLSAQEDPAPRAVVVETEGPVSPAMSDYLIRSIDEAAESGARIVILEMDTPGGLDTSMREIVSAILNAPIPVATYVSPQGARAASAGTYIAYASHVAAMAPATHLGAATPVAMGGGGGGGDDDEGGMPFGLQAEETADEEAPDDAADAADAARDEDGAVDAGVARDDADDADAAAERAAEEAAEEAAPPPDDQLTAQERKAINDAVSYIRGLAELRGRNADWAERAVREAATLTASNAEAEGVIDFVAADVPELLEKADGMVVEVAGAEVTLETAGLEIENVEPDWRTAFLSVITNPNVALILMLVGVYGLIFEFLNPGALVPGTIGGISLLLGLYSLALLPLNWAGVGLILLGLALIVAEAFAPSFGILGIGGTVALVLGMMIMFDGDAPGMEVSIPLVGGVAVTGLIVTLIIARLAMRSFSVPVVIGPEQTRDTTAQVLDWNGRQGHVWLQGERWRARSNAPLELAKGDTVRIERIDTLTVTVAPVD